MSAVLYLQTQSNVQVTNKNIYLADVAQLACSDSRLLNRMSTRLVMTIPKEEPGRYVMNATDLIQVLQKEEPTVEITLIGQPSFIITYKTPQTSGKLWRWVKIIFVCLVTFVGAGFSIMTFNTDVDTSGLFTSVYQQFTGESSDGFTELEIMYSIGIGIGVVFFFNHFGQLKITEDPTPMEVQMRVYEDQVNDTVMEKNSREGA